MGWPEKSHMILEMNNPAVEAIRSAFPIPLYEPWLEYVYADWLCEKVEDGTPLDGGPRELKQGWYVCEIAIVDNERVCVKRRIDDETVQRVVLQ